MRLKKSILILIFISIIPLLNGFNSSISRLFEFSLYNSSFNNAQIQIFDFLFTLGFAVGSLLGGIGIDLWNPKKILIYSVLAIVIPSGIVQFIDNNALIIGQRFILGTFLGLLLILLQVYLFETAPANHKGKFLVLFFLAGGIGGSLFYAFQSFFIIDNKLSSFYYARSILPFIVFPLLIFIVIRQIPNKLYTGNLRYADLKSVFLMHKRYILIVFILLSTIVVFGNASMYFFVTSHLIIDNNLESVWAINSISTTLGAIVGIFLIDSVGRKRLFLFGCKALIFISFVNSIIFLFINNFYVIVGLVNLYSFLFSITISVSILIIVFEYLPSGYRGRGLIIYSIICWIPQTLNKLYLHIHDIKSPYTLSISSFVVFGIVLAGYFIIRKYLIDTRGLTLDEIELRIFEKDKAI